MRCPIHQDVETRVEFDKDLNGWTGFCLKCLKHHPKCQHIHYMEQCDQVAGHEGLHKGKGPHGATWDVDPR